MSGIMKCNFCGCTDDKASPGGCHWVAHNVCSQCAAKIAALSLLLELFLAEQDIFLKSAFIDELAKKILEENEKEKTKP